MPKKILVVDDNKDTVAMIKTLLEKAGFDVATAPDGQEGYRKAQEVMPDMILLDIMMPIMDGFTMNKLLKENSQTEKIPVIIISGLVPAHGALFLKLIRNPGLKDTWSNPFGPRHC